MATGHTAVIATGTGVTKCSLFQSSTSPKPHLLLPRAVVSSARVSTDVARTTSPRDIVDDRQILDRRQRFVGWFHQAWPYVQVYKGSTFVVVIASEIVDDTQSFESILKDMALLHQLGIRFVLITETCLQADEIFEQKCRNMINSRRRYMTSEQMALEAAKEAAGRVENEILATISPGGAPPSILSIATGNFLAASKDGDHGEVRKIDSAGIRERLDQDSIVILSNLGYSGTGEVINCSTFEVASACALAMKADRLICVIDAGASPEENEEKKQRRLSINECLFNLSTAVSVRKYVISVVITYLT